VVAAWYRSPDAEAANCRNEKPIVLKAILTDSQFWIPVVVLALGIALLAYLR